MGRKKAPNPLKSNESGLELAFLRWWRTVPEPQYPNQPANRLMPVQQHQFAEGRKFSFDFAWPDLKIAVEIEGLTHSGGRHQRREGYTKDAEKYNMATLLGWRVLRYTSLDMTKRPVQVILEVSLAVEAAAFKRG